jgi:hypothetical protein
MEERLVSTNNYINNDEDLLRELMVVGNNPLPLIKKFESPTLASVTQNSFEIIDAIKSTELVNETDVANIKKAQTFLLTTYKDVPIYNTRIAKVTSILSDAKFVTNDAKFWQCKMQAEVHFNELVRALYKLDRVKIDLEELQYQISTIDTIINSNNIEGTKLDLIKLGFDKRRLVNKLNQYIYEMKLLEKDIKQRLREINDWAEISLEYEGSCEHSTSDFNEHTYGSHFVTLKKLLDNAKTPVERSQYLDQVNTFLRLLGRSPIK